MTTVHNDAGGSIGVVWDQHVDAEFQAKDADAAVATMTEDASLVHVPVATGARGRGALRDFYAHHFIPSWPEDVEVESLSRTVGVDRLVDELLIRCSHSRPMDFWLPGITPTNRKIELLTVAIISFERGRITSERIYWDQASLLVQVGVLNQSSAPMLGVNQARAVTDNGPLNELIA